MKKITNLVISKSGNTIETIINTNLLLKRSIRIYSLQKTRKVIYIF